MSCTLDVRHVHGQRVLSSLVLLFVSCHHAGATTISLDQGASSHNGMPEIGTFADPVTTIGVIFAGGSFLVGTISLLDQLTAAQRTVAPASLTLDYSATPTTLSLVIRGSRLRGDLVRDFIGTAVRRTV